MIIVTGSKVTNSNEFIGEINVGHTASVFYPNFILNKYQYFYLSLLERKET